MKRALVIAYIVAMATDTYSLALAFESTSSYSLFRFHWLEEGVSSQIGIGLVSTSFSDYFSRVVSLGTATEIKFLEAKRSVNEAEIAKYVDQQYGALPAKEKENFKVALIEAKTADEELKAKMASPTLTDDEKLIYAQERERLLKKIWEYEGELLDKYSQLFKPAKYNHVETELASIQYKWEEALHCLVAEECVGSKEEKVAVLTGLKDQKTSLVVDLIQSPVEAQKISDETLDSYMTATGHIRAKFGEYLNKLYSPVKGKP